MIKLIHWIIANREWLFSGLGLIIIGGLFRLLFYRNLNRIAQKQVSGDHCTNIQSAGDVKINVNKKGDL
jgi:hypothetical protein